MFSLLIKRSKKVMISKMFILPYNFSSNLYKTSLFECELIRKKNKKWCIGINDIYYYCGKNMKKQILLIE